MLKQPQVGDYMTVEPHSVGLDQSLATAVRRMQELRARHLPVLESGVLRGIISERDIALAEAFGLDPNQLSVEEAMTPEPYTVAPGTPLGRVARAMAEHKYGCAVVTDGQQLLGIFTTTDALRALADTLERSSPEPDSLAPSQVSEIMRNEHQNLMQLLDRTDSQARQLQADPAAGDRPVRALRDAARQLYAGLMSHIDLENELLVPVLKQTDAWGPMRADGLITCHAEQKRALEGALMELDDLTQPPAAIATHLETLVAGIRAALLDEQATLLGPDVLRDDPIIENPETD
jgi:acetoin utilization protein AcuB